MATSIQTVLWTGDNKEELAAFLEEHGFHPYFKSNGDVRVLNLSSDEPEIVTYRKDTIFGYREGSGLFAVDVNEDTFEEEASYDEKDPLEELFSHIPQNEHADLDSLLKAVFGDGAGLPGQDEQRKTKTDRAKSFMNDFVTQAREAAGQVKNGVKSHIEEARAEKERFEREVKEEADRLYNTSDLTREEAYQIARERVFKAFTKKQ